MPLASPPLAPSGSGASVLVDHEAAGMALAASSYLTSDSVPWTAWGRRLRQLDIRLAALPHQWLDEADEAERLRLHAWIAIQQGFIADLSETVRLRGIQAQGHRMQPEETLLLREVARFLQETEDAIAQGKQRFS